MKLGARVIVFAHWSSFRGMCGVVTRVRPTLMVRFDGYTHPMCVGEREVIEESSAPELSFTGAE